ENQDDIAQVVPQSRKNPTTHGQFGTRHLDLRVQAGRPCSKGKRLFADATKGWVAGTQGLSPAQCSSQGKGDSHATTIGWLLRSRAGGRMVSDSAGRMDLGPRRPFHCRKNRGAAPQ